MGLADKIQTMPKNLFILLGILGGVGYYFSSTGGIENATMQIANKQNELEAANEAISQAKKIAGDKAKFQQENQIIAEQLKAAVEYLPTKLNEQEVLSKITAEARAAGVNPTSIQPKTPVMKTFYEEVPMEIEMEGSYTQLVTFLSFISKIPRIVNIRGLELRAKDFNEETPVLKMKGTLVAYRYVEPKTEVSK